MATREVFLDIDSETTNCALSCNTLEGNVKFVDLRSDDLRRQYFGFRDREGCFFDRQTTRQTPTMTRRYTTIYRKHVIARRHNRKNISWVMNSCRAKGVPNNRRSSGFYMHEVGCLEKPMIIPATNSVCTYEEVTVPPPTPLRRKIR